MISLEEKEIQKMQLEIEELEERKKLEKDTRIFVKICTYISICSIVGAILFFIFKLLIVFEIFVRV